MLGFPDLLVDAVCMSCTKALIDPKSPVMEELHTARRLDLPGDLIKYRFPDPAELALPGHDLPA